MKDTIYVSGHKNPDTDSICSAIAYAAFKNVTSNKNYIPIRLGEINDETRYVLNYFNVEEPMFMDSIKLKVSDLEYSDVPSLTPNISIERAQNYLTDNNIDYISVVDDKNILCGMLTSSSFNKIYTDVWSDTILFDSKTSIDNIVETLQAEKLYINNTQSYFPGRIRVAAMSKDNIETYIDKGDIIITGDRNDVLELFVDKEVSLIILTGNSKLDDNTLEKVKHKGITVISTKYDSFTTSRLLLLSVPISYVMVKDNIVTFSTDELVKDIKYIMIKTRYRAFPIVDEENHVLGMVSRHGLLSKDKKQIIQVDHNEYAQAIDGIEEADIVEVIDHHRVADIQTSYPIFFRNEPVGSTSTIVAHMFFEQGIILKKEIAGLLLSGILSDTMMFKSPTSTQMDIDMCNQLAPIAGVKDIKKYALEMQKESTKLGNKTVAEIFNIDFKEFRIGNLKVGISQMNTLDIDGFANIKDKMLTYMNERLIKENYNVLLLILTNIIDEGSLFVATGETVIIEEAFNIDLINNEAYMPNILSRKKQVVPAISKYVTDEEF